MLDADDPINEIGGARAVKEHPRRLLASPDLETAAERRHAPEHAVATAAMPETDRLLRTITAWWPAIEVLIITAVTNARTEAANTILTIISSAPGAVPQPCPLQRPYPPAQHRSRAA
jgi:hypothetical protein